MPVLQRNVFTSPNNLELWNYRTTEPPNDFLAEKLKRGELKTFAVSPKIIWVYFHVVRSSSGTGGVSNADVNAALNTLKNDFGTAQICILEKGRSFINDDYYYNFDPNKFNQLVTVNNQADAINLYFVPTGTFQSSGRANGIPSNEIVLDGDLIQTKVVSHEVGHC